MRKLNYEVTDFYQLALKTPEGHLVNLFYESEE